MWVVRRQVIGLVSAAVAAAALAACASSPERGEVGADTTVPTISDVVNDAATVATGSDLSHSNGPWTWTGTLIQEGDGVPRACFGEIQPSDPPSCPSGMPILNFDLIETTWAERYEQASRTVAFANIVGHPTEAGFVLDAPISKASGSLDQLECEHIDTGAKSSDTLNPQPAFDLLEEESARAAGVWFTTGGIADKVRMDASVLILDDLVIEWFEAQPEFDGFELTVCPQLREL
jgi:hypothetical protein